MVMNNMNKHFILLLLALFTLPLIAQNSGSFERRVLIEEGTGTRCPNCPRGFVGIKELKEAYGDRAVVIAVHQFDNRDPMYLRHSNYPDCNFAGFPDCIFNRDGYHYDPLYGWDLGSGSILDVAPSYFQSTTSTVDIQADASWNADSTAVVGNATIESQTSGETYEVQMVLVADSLTGSETYWYQSNIYYNRDAQNYPAGMADFCEGGKYGQGGFQWIYDDVAIASSYSMGRTQIPRINNLAPNTKATVSYTLALPVVGEKYSTAAQDLLPAAIRKDKVSMVAIVTDSYGKVLNCVKVGIMGSNTNYVKAVSADCRANNDVYSIDGHKLSGSSLRNSSLLPHNIYIVNGKKIIAVR